MTLEGVWTTEDVIKEEVQLMGLGVHSTLAWLADSGSPMPDFPPSQKDSKPQNGISPLAAWNCYLEGKLRNDTLGREKADVSLSTTQTSS